MTMLKLLKKSEAGAELPAEKTDKTQAYLPKPEDYDIRLRPDRVGQYFKKFTNDFVFDEFSDAFIKRTGAEFLRGVPIPLRKEDVDGFRGGEGIQMRVLAMNIAWIMGIDPKFKYIEQYLEFIRRYSGKRTVLTLVKRGRDFAEIEDYYTAAIHFRAALCIDPDNLHAMYSYARACRELYLAGDSEEYIGLFKAESIEFF